MSDGSPMTVAGGDPPPAVRRPTPAEAYQEYFAPAIFEPLADVLLAFAPPEPGEHVLDLACGTGIVTRRLADLVGAAGRAVGVDINPGMIEVAQARSARGASVDYLVGDGQALDLDDGAFDRVVCQQGLQFFPDRGAGVVEMRRVLRPGGRVVVATWQGLDSHPLYRAMAEVEAPHLAAFGLPVTMEELAAPFSLGDRGVLSTLFEAAGFRRVCVTRHTIQARFPDADRFVERMEYAYAAVVPAFAEDPAAFDRYLDRITRDTAHLVQDHRDGDNVVIPMHTHLLTAIA